MRAVRTDRWKFIRNLTPEAVHTTHMDKAKAVDGVEYWNSWVRKAESDPAAAAVVERYRRRPAEELYDLSSDPYELHNLAGDKQYAETLAGLRADVAAWMAEQGDLGLKTEEEVRARFLPAEK
jgi:arylsulfatase A-like enzyme